MISVAIGELGCPSLEYVYDMTWAEFRIRLFAWRRLEKNDWYKVREIAYQSLVGSHVKHTSLPKTREAYLPLDTRENAEKTLKRFERIRQVQKEYHDAIKKQRDG